MQQIWDQWSGCPYTFDHVVYTQSDSMDYELFAKYLCWIITPDFQSKDCQRIYRVSLHGSRARFPSRVKLNFWRKMLSTSPSAFMHTRRLKGYSTYQLPNWGARHCEGNELVAYWSSAMSFFTMALISCLCHKRTSKCSLVLSFFIACSDWSGVFSPQPVRRSLF